VRRRRQVASVGLLAALLISCSTSSDVAVQSPSVASPSPQSSPEPSDSPTLVPDLVGLALAAAKSTARTAGLRAVVEDREFSSEPLGTVLEQDVPAGSIPSAGERRIQLVVAIHPRVPSVVGLTIGEARDRFVSVSLRVGTIRRVESTEAQGLVLNQGADPGDRVPAGTRVRLAIVDPHVCGSPLNPWCFSLSGGGSLIYNAPSAFCSYFNCIASFWSSTNGYVIQCVDGEFSHSGGVQGSCSYHDGNARPLYRP
jgi:hypothetical protein